MFRILSAVLLLACAASAQRAPATANVAEQTPTASTPLLGEWLPLDLQFDLVMIDGQEFDHGTLAVTMGGFDVPYEIDISPDGMVSVSVSGQIIGIGGIEILDQIPGVPANATVGSKACWSIPLGGGVVTTLTVEVKATADPLSVAVAEYKAKIAALKAAGWKPQPSSACK
jgi:hypothetical protein